EMSILQQNTLKQIPTNITSALARFNLHPSTTVYATCPLCSCLYKPVFKPGLSTAEYPSHCTNKPKPWLPICNQPLLQLSSTGHCSLIKPYVYHHFHDFVASLLARSEIDAIINEPCDQLMGSLDQPAPLNSKDIWDSEFLRTFQALFIDRKGESHLVFSLNIDFFNVKETTSCGVISCACLNLPLGICYKPENMFLAGIMPGPNEPPGDQLNHFL
ncbi:hypothetical protein SCLCIDRAFT_81884, partial [Scleroderma citrinum Foug A]